MSVLPCEPAVSRLLRCPSPFPLPAGGERGRQRCECSDPSSGKARAVTDTPSAKPSSRLRVEAATPSNLITNGWAWRDVRGQNWTPLPPLPACEEKEG